MSNNNLSGRRFSNAEILKLINNAHKKSINISQAAILLVFSSLVFIFASRWGGDADYEIILILVLVLLIHEFGHIAAMIVLGYKNLSVLFIPFLGAIARGQPRTNDAFNNMLVLIAGPVVGFLSCYVALLIWSATSNPIFLEYIFYALLLNIFNLLPIPPLDGGQIINQALFENSSRLELLYRILSFSLLLFAGIFFMDILLLILSLAIIIPTPIIYKTSVVAQKLKKNCSGNEQKLNEEIVGEIREKLEMQNVPFDAMGKTKALVKLVEAVWCLKNKKYPKLGKTALILFIYIFSATYLPYSTLRYCARTIGKENIHHLFPHIDQPVHE